MTNINLRQVLYHFGILAFASTFSTNLAIAQNSATAAGQETVQDREVKLPSSQDMSRILSPAIVGRLRFYDRRLGTEAAELAATAQKNYADPDRLTDLTVRIRRMIETGNPMDILTPEEQSQYKKNSTQRQVLEKSFFKKFFLNLPMKAFILGQRALTNLKSPEPKGDARTKMKEFWSENREKNVLYSSWNQDLDKDSTQTHDSPKKWGDLIVRFNQDAEFRDHWVQTHPETLPKLKAMSEVWAWDDSSVREVKVFNSGTPAEFWVMKRVKADGKIPNRFEAILRRDFESLVKIEFASTLYFNRLTQITKEGAAEVYSLTPVEKGRSMESMSSYDERGSDKKTFSGAELIRKSKSDEFPQMNDVNKGILNLFIGLRTMPLHEARRLMKLYPELMLAVGQMGFSVTGGTAQTTSNRTDGVEQQAAKLVATLLDIIEFSQTKDVQTWFERNVKHVLRTILGGVGSGGHQALTEPGRTKGDPSAAEDKTKEKTSIGGAPSCAKVL